VSPKNLRANLQLTVWQMCAVLLTFKHSATRTRIAL